MGYPTDLLSTRAVVKPNLWAVIPEDGLVNNVIPCIQGCTVSIVASPKMGASFVQYVINGTEKSGTVSTFGNEDNIETFIYIVEGKVKISVNGNDYTYKDGGYAFSPAGTGVDFKIESNRAKILLYKQKYTALNGLTPQIVTGNINDVQFRVYDGMANVFIKDFLPTDDLAYDMNMHILSFLPGGCHPFVETHVQEHGAYILAGQGVYFMNDQWLPIKKNDFMWFGPYCPQCSYGVGREPFEYIYSKDCNRDVIL